MKKRVVNVTKVSKTVDKRLEMLEKRLERISKMISHLEKVLNQNKTADSSKTISYTIRKTS